MGVKSGGMGEGSLWVWVTNFTIAGLFLVQ